MQLEFNSTEVASFIHGASSGHSKMPAGCSRSLLPALGRLGAAGNAGQHRRGSSRSPAVAQFTSLTLDGPIKPRYQYFTRQ